MNCNERIENQRRTTEEEEEEEETIEKGTNERRLKRAQVHHSPRGLSEGSIYYNPRRNPPRWNVKLLGGVLYIDIFIYWNWKGK